MVAAEPSTRTCELVPTGCYALSGLDGPAEERFSCAPGPVGWRYVGTRTEPDAAGAAVAGAVAGSADVTVDARWRPLRVEVRRGDHVVRAGLTAAGLAWVRDGVEGASDASALAGPSPALLVARARLVAPLAAGGPAVLRVLRLDGPALAPLGGAERWRLAEVAEQPTDLGPLAVQHWVVDDLAAGQRAELHLAGDVVVAAEGPTWSVTLEELDGPPNFLSG